ncbi:MAG: DUF5673 domain-containing protein [Tissierellia bacterium]|nr:DUF5673 domain-containing protein [Tissierellia bacterium]
MENSFTGNTILDLMFILVLVFAGKQLYNVYKSKSNLSKVIAKFPQRKKSIMLFASSALIILGIVYFTQNPGIIGAVYILLGIVFLFLTSEKIVFTEDGVYFNGKYDSYKEIRKWAFDDKEKTLYLTIKERGKELNRIIPINPEDKIMIHEIIKSKKKK